MTKLSTKQKQIKAEAIRKRLTDIRKGKEPSNEEMKKVNKALDKFGDKEWAYKNRNWENEPLINKPTSEINKEFEEGEREFYEKSGRINKYFGGFAFSDSKYRNRRR